MSSPLRTARKSQMKRARKQIAIGLKLKGRSGFSKKSKKTQPVVFLKLQAELRKSEGPQSLVTPLTKVGKRLNSPEHNH